ncbi:DUF4181 domain-containing protein [Peribacillus sp. SIMBA_075]|uniref:DUF4181 domain-containing protein n=1 Tax=Peribacillus sp. SIMBA_075 TaxID=3085813 RepID=UPI00397CE2E1
MFFIIIIIIITLFINKFLTKWLGVEKKEKISETSGKNIDRWGRGLILLTFLCTLPYAIEEDKNVMWYMCFFIVSFGFQSFMEWKYLKTSKQYVITLTYLLIALVIMYNVDYFIYRI